MDRYSENQYDDDLMTLQDEYDDSYFSDSDDLFDLNRGEDSPLSRLKSLVLSIDWEITDEVLLLFNQELVSLRDVWAGEKINLVYVQALEKISKYIYARKADAHPSAIKMLLTFYHNLEKIVSSEMMTDEEKTAILREDVKAFEQLKKHIKSDLQQQGTPAAAELETGRSVPVAGGSRFAAEPAAAGSEDEGALSFNVSGAEQSSVAALTRLKAIILGLDWEITDEYLANLKFEVAELKDEYGENATRFELLSGIGEVGEYVQEKKSEAHSEAFKVLHSLFEGLEQIVATPMSPEEERTAVFPLFEKLQAFRMIVENNIQYRDDLPEDEPVAALSFADETELTDDLSAGEIAPAFAGFGEEDVHGFREEDEIVGLGEEGGALVEKVGNLFGDE